MFENLPVDQLELRLKIFNFSIFALVGALAASLLEILKGNSGRLVIALIFLVLILIIFYITKKLKAEILKRTA